MVTFVIPQRHVALFISVGYTSDCNDIIMQNPNVSFEILVLHTLVIFQTIS